MPQLLREPLINSAARLTVPFPPFASCKFLDLPPVSLQNLQARLTKNSLVSQPPHLISVSLGKHRTMLMAMVSRFKSLI